MKRNVGKSKNALSKLRVKKPNSNETYTCYERGEIESKLVEHNRQHFSKAKNTAAYKNRVIRALNQDNIRDKILNGTIKESEVNDKDVHEFLKLLSLPNR